MSFRRNLVKFAAVLSVFFTGISFINVPNQTQTVHAAEQSTTEKREAVADLAKKQVGSVTFTVLPVHPHLTAQA